MKTLTTILTTILCVLSLNVNALTFIGSDKHVDCAEKIAIELGIQDADYRVYMADEVMSRKIHAYVAGTSAKNTIALVVNKSKRANKYSSNITIAHEMVHVMQKIRGDVFDLTVAYKHQAHEIEAYELEKQLVRVCN